MTQPNRVGRSREHCHVCGASLTLQPVYVHGITDLCQACHDKQPDTDYLRQLRGEIDAALEAK